MTQNHPRAMLVNVGGATAPAIHALNEQRPPYICFFVSPDSKPHIREKILPALEYQPEHYDWIETTSAQSLLECFRILAENLPRILEKWGVTPDALGVEFTAGTKPMSVAAVLATIDATSLYYYVGAHDPSGRDRDGIGVVLDGKEYTWFQTNPWEALAIQARKEIALLFNHGRFTDAKEKAQQLAALLPEMRPVYDALASLIEGYALWDRFEYAKAQQFLFKSLQQLRLHIAGREEPLRVTLDEVEQHTKFLEKLNKKDVEAQQLDIMDMLANAARRADVAQKYDDAVARLYSTLEALARNRLFNAHQVKANAVRPDQVPQPIRDEYIRLYGEPQNPKAGLRIGLDASYRLLAELGDELGKKYLAREKELSKVLLARNQSRLAHGTDPVKEQTYRDMRAIILDFANIDEDVLPRFPQMRL